MQNSNLTWKDIILLSYCHQGTVTYSRIFIGCWQHYCLLTWSNEFHWAACVTSFASYNNVSYFIKCARKCKVIITLDHTPRPGGQVQEQQVWVPYLLYHSIKTTYIHIHAHTDTDTHTRAHTHIQAHSHAHAHTRTRTHQLTHTHTHAHTHTHTHTRIHTHAHACVHTHMCAHTHAHACTHTHTYTDTHTHIHTHTHTHTYTHTHTHTLGQYRYDII